MQRILGIGFLVSAFISVAALAAAPKTNDIDSYDELPSGPPSEPAQLFHSALAVPNLAESAAKDKQALLEVVTVRYKNRGGRTSATRRPRRIDAIQ